MENIDPKMRNVIFFDGVCHLCNGFVDAIINRDKNHRYVFAPLQGETAASLLSSQERAHLDTVIYFEKGQLYDESTAIIKILTGLGGAYVVFRLAWLLPKIVRDYLYRFVAKNRYAWFGKNDLCRIPLPEEKAYLLP